MLTIEGNGKVVLDDAIKAEVGVEVGGIARITLRDAEGNQIDVRMPKPLFKHLAWFIERA